MLDSGQWAAAPALDDWEAAMFVCLLFLFVCLFVVFFVKPVVGALQRSPSQEEIGGSSLA